MNGFGGYDQWKTASPHDGEPDVTEEGEKMVKFLEKLADKSPEQLARMNPLEWREDMDRAVAVIRLLMDFIEENV